MAGSDPPQPIPFPVRIVQDTAGKAKDGSSSNETRTDYFYAAWDKFLALEPQRTAGPVGEGSAIEKKAPTTWEQAANECRNRVAAIVQECQRLNQKYSDVAFDLEDDDDCLRSLGGLLPRVSWCCIGSPDAETGMICRCECIAN